MKIILIYVSVMLLGWNILMAIGGVERTTQPMQFTGGAEFSVEKTTDTMKFTGQ